MDKKIDYIVKESLVSLAGTCFWYWGSIYSFLESCGVQKSIYQKYPKDNKYQLMRNVLVHLEDSCDYSAINTIISAFYKMKKPIDTNVPDIEKAKKLLAEFQELIGNDPIEKELERRKKEEFRKVYAAKVDTIKSNNNRMQDLNSSFNALFASNDITPQQKGYRLEEIFCDLLQINEIEYSRPYRHPGEQIDGHFKYEKFDYLIEVKFEQHPATLADLSIFDGKIKGKAQSTRGLFLAVNGFNPHAITRYSGDSPRIILMTGEDLVMVLNGRVLFHDAMAAKVNAIVKHGIIDFPIRTIVT